MSRPRHSLLALATIVIVAGGCAGGVAPTTSPSPTTPVTQTPSAEATIAATASPTPAPTLIPYPGPSIPPGTTTIEITAIYHLTFDRDDLAAPANQPFVIHFANNDAVVGGGKYEVPAAHNVAIKSGTVLLFNPLPAIISPATADYFISEGLPAGVYNFLCTVHPLMRGTLTVR